MKRYVQFLAALNVCLILVLLFYPYRSERTYYAVESIKNFYREDLGRGGLTTLVLGDSTMAFGIRAEEFKNAYSLALPSSTNVNVWLELARFLSRYPAPKCIVYSTSYIPFNFENGFLGKHTSAGVYSWDELQDVFTEASAQNLAPFDHMSSTGFRIRMFYLKYLDFTPYSQAQLRQAVVPWLPSAQLFKKERDRAIQMKGYLLSHKRRAEMMSERQEYLHEAFQPFPLDDYYFDKILQRAQEIGSKFIFVEMPIRDPAKDPRVDAFNEAHLDYVKKKMSSFPNTRFVSLKPTIAALRDEDFFDANHLNITGSLKFTKALVEEVAGDCEKK